MSLNHPTIGKRQRPYLLFQAPSYAKGTNFTFYFSYAIEGSIPTQNFNFSLKICHVSCSHLPQPICIPHGNYIQAHVKTKSRAFYSS